MYDRDSVTLVYVSDNREQLCDNKIVARLSMQCFMMS